MYVRKIDFSDIIASPAQQEFLLTEYRNDKAINLGGRRGPYPNGRFWEWCNQKLKEAKMGHIEPRGAAKTAPRTGRAKSKAVSGVKRKAAEEADSEETEAAAEAAEEKEAETEAAKPDKTSASQQDPSVLIMQDFQKAMQQAHGDVLVKATVSAPDAEMVAINTKCITDEQVQLQRQEALLKQPDTPAGLFMGAALAVQLGLCKSPGEYMTQYVHNKVLLASLEWDDVPAIHDALEKAVTHQTKISIKEGQEKQRRQMSEQEQLEEERLLEEERERIVQGDVQERERERMAQEKLAQEQEIERMAQEKLATDGIPGAVLAVAPQPTDQQQHDEVIPGSPLQESKTAGSKDVPEEEDDKRTESKEATPQPGDLTTALARVVEMFHASPADLKAAFDAISK